MSEVKKHLETLGKECKVFGTFSAESCDYPVITAPAAKAVADGICDIGIFICSTGIGMSIAANKVPGIRAALCTSLYMTEMTRSHNNANVLVLGARTVDSGLAIEIVDKFLSTDFSDEERHRRRVEMLNDLDKKRKE